MSGEGHSSPAVAALAIHTNEHADAPRPDCDWCPVVDTKATTCIICHRERTAEDKNYSPMQVITGQPCGWYSGDDGEICGHDMDVTLGRQ